MQPKSHIAQIRRQTLALAENQEGLLISLPADMHENVMKMCAQGRICSWKAMQWTLIS
jgi:hypothetical protein